jgi:hypothetical protein
MGGGDVGINTVIFFNLSKVALCPVVKLLYIGFCVKIGITGQMYMLREY